MLGQTQGEMTRVCDPRTVLTRPPHNARQDFCVCPARLLRAGERTRVEWLARLPVSYYGFTRSLPRPHSDGGNQRRGERDKGRTSGSHQNLQSGSSKALFFTVFL